MDTAPLPRIGDDGGLEPAGGTGRTVQGPLRVLDALAATVSGGMIAIGIVLVALQVLAPVLSSDVTTAVAHGPGWGRALIQFGAGVIGEGVVVTRRRADRPVRVVLDLGILLVSAGALWLVWWA